METKRGLIYLRGDVYLSVIGDEIALVIKVNAAGETQMIKPKDIGITHLRNENIEALDQWGVTRVDATALETLICILLGHPGKTDCELKMTKVYPFTF